MVLFQIQTNPLGCFAIKDRKIVLHRLFVSEQKTTRDIAKKLIYARNNLLSEEREIIKDLCKGQDVEIAITNLHRLKDEKGKFSAKFVELEPSKILSLEEISRQIMPDSKKLRELIWAVNLEITKEEMRLQEPDKIIIQLINTIDELNNILNLMNERLREYYGLYFPEIDIIEDHEVYASIAALGNKENLDLEKVNLSEKIKEKIKEKSITSFGMKLEDEEIISISLIANEILNLYKLKAQLEENLKNQMTKTCPNITCLAGYMLGARLLARAGSLEKLAFMPASTIQMLGAEKALFKFLRTKKLPPKHGIIFTLPEISSAPKKNRGKIARYFATKIAIAARVDYFKGKFIGNKIGDKFKRYVENLTKIKT